MIKILTRKLKINRSELSKTMLLLALTLFLVLYIFVANEIIWSLYAIYLVLIGFTRMKFYVKPESDILALSIPLVWGLLMSFDNDILNTAKGFFYLSIPIIMVLIGLQLSRIFDTRQFFRFIIIAGNIIAILFIIFTLLRAGFTAFVSPYIEARFIVGSGSPACVMSLVFGLFSNRFGLDLYKSGTQRWLSIIINLLAIYLFASRTYWVMMFLFIILFSYKSMKKDWLLFFLMFLCVAMIGIIIWVNSTHGLTFKNSLLFKLVNSFHEIKVEEIKGSKDINIYYRGYESFRSWETFRHGNILEILFGGGFGQLVDLKTKVLLAGEYWSAVPWVHNGFFFILVKIGLLGLISVLLFFAYVIQAGLKIFKSSVKEYQFIGTLILCCAAAMIGTNYVDCGLYNFEMSLILITIGYLIAIHPILKLKLRND